MVDGCKDFYIKKLYLEISTNVSQKTITAKMFGKVTLIYHAIAFTHVLLEEIQLLAVDDFLESIKSGVVELPLKLESIELEQLVPLACKSPSLMMESSWNLSEF